MFSKLKWRIKRVWQGPASNEHFDARSGWTLLIPSHGGLKRWFTRNSRKFWGGSWKLLKWVVVFSAGVILTLIIQHFWGILFSKE